MRALRYLFVGLLSACVTAVPYALLHWVLIGSIQNSEVWTSFVLLGTPVHFVLVPGAIWAFEQLGLRRDHYFSAFLTMGAALMVLFSVVFVFIKAPLVSSAMTILGYGPDQHHMFFIHQIIFGVPATLIAAVSATVSNRVIETNFPSTGFRTAVSD